MKVTTSPEHLQQLAQELRGRNDCLRDTVNQSIMLVEQVNDAISGSDHIRNCVEKTYDMRNSIYQYCESIDALASYLDKEVNMFFTAISLDGKHKAPYILAADSEKVYIYAEGSFRYGHRTVNVDYDAKTESQLNLLSDAEDAIQAVAMQSRSYLQMICSKAESSHNECQNYSQSAKYVLHVEYADGGFFMWSSNNNTLLDDASRLLYTMVSIVK